MRTWTRSGAASRRRRAGMAVAAAASAVTVCAGVGVADPADPDRAVARGTSATSVWQALWTVRLADAGGQTTWDTVVSSDGRRGLTLTEGELRSYDLTKSPGRYMGRTTAAGGRIVAARPGRSYVYVVDGEDMHVVDVRKTAPRKVRTLVGSDMIRDLAITPDGKTMYVAFGASMSSRYGIRVYSLATPSQPRWLRTVKTDDPSPSALSIDRRTTRLAVGHSLVGSVQLFSISRPTTPRRLGPPTKMPASNSVTSMVFSAGGTALYAVGADHPYLTTVDVRRRMVSHNKDYSSTFGRYTDVRDVTMTADGSRLYLLLDGQEENQTVAVVTRSSRALEETFTGATYPRGLSISQAGPTKDTGYFASSPTFQSAGYLVAFGRR